MYTDLSLSTTSNNFKYLVVTQPVLMSTMETLPLRLVFIDSTTDSRQRTSHNLEKVYKLHDSELT